MNDSEEIRPGETLRTLLETGVMGTYLVAPPAKKKVTPGVFWLKCNGFVHMFLRRKYKLTSSPELIRKEPQNTMSAGKTV